MGLATLALAWELLILGPGLREGGSRERREYGLAGARRPLRWAGGHGMTGCQQVLKISCSGPGRGCLFRQEQVLVQKQG